MYDDFAKTFSCSRVNHPWPEIDYSIAKAKEMGAVRILDIGCGNGRFLEEGQKQWFSPAYYLGIDNSERMIEWAKLLYPEYRFEVRDMRNLEWVDGDFDIILLIASFHHLETVIERMTVLDSLQCLLAPHGIIFMTNWNLRDQEMYRDSYLGNGDYSIKIGAYTRYYHGFTVNELDRLFRVNDYTIIENRIFEGGKNIISVIQKWKANF